MDAGKLNLFFKISPVGTAVRLVRFLDFKFNHLIAGPSAGGSLRGKHFYFLDSKLHHIAVLDDVFFAFGADEFFLKVGMDFGGITLTFLIKSFSFKIEISNLTKHRKGGAKMENDKIGYEIGKWYMVEIDSGVFIPAKFTGLIPGCDFKSIPFHNFLHPGQAVFENVKLYGSCGFEGADWQSAYKTGGYNSFKPKYRPVTENELWAVKAIEEFQKIVAGQKQAFSIVMNNGWKLEGKVKPPGKKDNLPGKYFARIVNRKTGEEREGPFNYDGKSESVRAFINSKLSSPEDWHIHTLKLKEESFGLKQESD